MLDIKLIRTDPEAVKAGKGGVFKMKPVGTFMGECRQGSIRT